MSHCPLWPPCDTDQTRGPGQITFSPFSLDVSSGIRVCGGQWGTMPLKRAVTVCKFDTQQLTLTHTQTRQQERIKTNREADIGRANPLQRLKYNPNVIQINYGVNVRPHFLEAIGSARIKSNLCTSRRNSWIITPVQFSRNSRFVECVCKGAIKEAVKWNWLP